MVAGQPADALGIPSQLPERYKAKLQETSRQRGYRDVPDIIRQSSGALETSLRFRDRGASLPGQGILSPTSPSASLSQGT